MIKDKCLHGVWAQTDSSAFQTLKIVSVYPGKKKNNNLHLLTPRSTKYLIIIIASVMGLPVLQKK